MRMLDFQCPACGHEFEEILGSGEADPTCPLCGEGPVGRLWRKTAAVLTTIVPDYPGARARKAGYQHTTFADQPATKIQSGYGGCGHPPD